MSAPRCFTPSDAKAKAAALVAALIADVSEGIKVLQTRDGVNISDEQVTERAKNIVFGLVGNYRVYMLPEATVPEGMEAHARRIIQ